MNPKKENKRELNLLLLNGLFWSLHNGLAIAFVIPLAIALGASEIEIGILGAITYIAVVLSQIPGAELVEHYKKRKRINNICELGSKLALLPIVAIPFVLCSSSALAWLILLFFISEFMLYMSLPAWTSLMGELVPRRMRGVFFGKRNMIMTLGATLIGLAAGWFLDLFPKTNLTGFAVIFAIAFVLGIIAVVIFNRIKERPLLAHKHTARDFFKLPNELKQLITFRLVFNLGYGIALPFFTVYMLVNLNMSYTNFVLFSVLSAVASMFAQRPLGRLADRYGDKPVTALCTIGTAMVPLMFMFVTPDKISWLIPIQIFSGIVWIGFNVASYNLLLDIIDGEESAIQVADYNILTSIPMIIGPIIGGIMAQNAVIATALGGITLVFFAAFIIRAFSVLLVARMEEPRAKREYGPAIVIRQAMRVHPVKGMMHEAHVATGCFRLLWRKK